MNGLRRLSPVVPRHVFALALAASMAAIVAACSTSDSPPESPPPSPSWADQRNPSGFQKLAEPQPPCRDCLAFERVAVIGDQDGPGILPYDWQMGIVNRDGNYWTGQGGTIKVFDPRGVFLRDIGQRGQGPLEFQHPRPVFVDEAGNVHVYDAALARETVVSDEFTLVDTKPTLQAAYDLSPLSGGRYAVSTWIMTLDRVGFPLHVVDGTEVTSSFGAAAVDEHDPLTRFTARRQVATDEHDHIFSMEHHSYLIEVWTDEGGRIMGLEGPQLNDREISPGSWSLDANPPPVGWVRDIQVFEGNQLWVLSWQRRENWRSAAREQVRPNGDVSLDTVEGTLHGFYRSRIDVIGLGTATLIASGTHEGLLAQFLGGRRVVESDPTEDGDWRAVIWRADLMSK